VETQISRELGQRRVQPGAGGPPLCTPPREEVGASTYLSFLTHGEGTG